MNRVTEVTDHNGRKTAYGWDNVGNKTVQGYTDGTQVDYYYDEENQIVEIPSVDTEQLSATTAVVNRPAIPDPTADTAAGIVLKNQAVTVQETNIQLLNTVKNDASVEGNGDGNGQVHPGQ